VLFLDPSILAGQDFFWGYDGKMKKVLAICVCFVAFCAFSAYAAVSADSPVYVRVGIYENQPKIFTDEQGNAQGFWPEIISYMASKEGWEIQWVHGTWTQCLERLKNNEIDLMPDVAYSDARDQSYDFSREDVYISWSTAYTQKDSRIQTMPDLHGKTVAVLRNSINYTGPDGIKKLADSFGFDCTFIETDSYLDVLTLVQNKAVDAGVVSKDFGHLHENEMNIKPTAIILQPVHLFFAFPATSQIKPYLIERIDYQVKQIQADGNSVYYQALKKWFGTNAIEKPVLPDYAKWTLIGVLGLVAVLGMGTVTFRYQVRRKTKELAADITEREQTEKALRESEEKLRHVFEAVPEGITIADLDGVIMDTNQAVVNMYGYDSKDELIGRNGGEFIAEKDRERTKDYLAGLIEKTVVRNSLVTLIRKDGREFPAELSAAVIKDTAGHPIGMIVVTADVTARMQAIAEHEKIGEYKELDKLKTNLLSTISHELRTPLASIKGYASLLLMYNEKLEEKQKNESLEAIDRSTDRLTELIDHLLDMSRLDAGLLRLGLDTVNPKDLVTAAVEEAKMRAPRYRFSKEINGRLPGIIADGRRLRQIIDNILDNAIKYSPQNTEITVRAEVKGADLLFSISDHGRGIPESEFKKIFERMYRIEQRLQKDPGGLGLGLSLCKSLVEAHGGRIWVESVIHKGSTFYFTIPLKPADRVRSNVEKETAKTNPDN